MQNFFEYLNSPQAQRGLDMIAGISPRERAQIMMEESKARAYQQQEAANQRLGQIMSQGGLTDDAIAEMWTVSPEYAIKLVEMKRAQEEQAMRNQLLQGAAGDPSGLILGGMALGDSSLIQGGSALMTLQEKQDAAAKEAAAAQRLSGASQGGGYLSSGLDVDLSGVGGQAPTGEQLAPIDGLESVPPDPMAKINKLMQERKALALHPDANTAAYKAAIAQKDEEIDIEKSLIPSPQDALKLQEAATKKEKAKLLATEALYYANSLLENKEGLARATGPIGGLVPNVWSENASNAAADLEALGSILTVDNLDLMSGILTDTDVKILRQIAAGGIEKARGDARVMAEVTRIRDTLQKNLLGQEKGKANQNSTAGLRAEAQAAIAEGASPESVAARFKKLTGEDL